MSRTWLILSMVAACLPGACTGNKPSASAPWVVVLDEAATRSQAKTIVEKLSESHPELLEDATTISCLDQTTVRHLVISPGQAGRQQAETLAGKLSKPKGVRLRVVDTTALKTVSEEEDFSSGAPEDAEQLEHLAALLPEPSEAELDSFILWTTPEKPGRTPLRPFGHGCPGSWWSAFKELGWQATAQAVYLAGSAAGQEKVYVFVGRPEGGESGEAQKRVYNFLLDYVGPTEEEWEEISKKKSRKRRRRRRRKKPKPTAVVDMVLKEPPAGKQFVLPWGSAEVVFVERVAFEKKPKIKKDTPVQTALLGPTPDGQGVILVLYQPEKASFVENLLAPHGLGDHHGLAYTGQVAGFWQVLSEVSLEEEQLSYLGMQRLIRRFDRKRRRSKLIKRLARKPVFLAGYRSMGRPLWQISWADLGNLADAQKLYDSAYVEPRKEKIQRLLNSRRKLRYDLGISFREIGDVLGWHLRGAQAGALQELYFQRKGVIWLLQAIARGSTRMDPEGLLARSELLQIWDEVAENP